jgi:hypothetical protein
LENSVHRGLTPCSLINVANGCLDIQGSKIGGRKREVLLCSLARTERLRTFILFQCLYSCWLSPEPYTSPCTHNTTTRGNVVVMAPCYKPEGRGFETRLGERFFSIYIILPGALGPAVYSSSNRNEYQKQKNNVSGE